MKRGEHAGVHCEKGVSKRHQNTRVVPQLYTLKRAVPGKGYGRPRPADSFAKNFE